jgi:hypothetical protein
MVIKYCLLTFSAIGSLPICTYEGGGRSQKCLKRCLCITWMLPKPIQPGSICYSSGWGGINPLNVNASKPEIIANPLADNLKAVTLEVISSEECFESFNQTK